MSPSSTTPWEILRSPSGAKVLSLRGMLTVWLDPADCEELCRQLCDDHDDPERASLTSAG